MLDKRGKGDQLHETTAEDSKVDGKGAAPDARLGANGSANEPADELGRGRGLSLTEVQEVLHLRTQISTDLSDHVSTYVFDSVPGTQLCRTSSLTMRECR